MKYKVQMKTKNNCQVIGIPVASTTDKFLHPSSLECSLHKHNKKDSFISWINKFNKKADSYAQGIRDHVTLAPRISETVKGKLSLGTKILQAGGIEKIFRRYFCVNKREKLMNAFQCYLSTTSGPIAGLLFISNENIAFRSDRSLTYTSPKGEITRVPYKVLIPSSKIQRVAPNENAEKPKQKYIQLVTVDDFEFWFMGFVSYQRSLKCLQRVISESE